MTPSERTTFLARLREGTPDGTGETLDLPQAALFLGVTEAELRDFETGFDFPKPIMRIGDRAFYSKPELRDCKVARQIRGIQERKV